LESKAEGSLVLKKIILAVLGLVLIFVAAVAMQPDEYHVERSASMDAPVAEVFSQVNDFHKWQAWSPWAKLDPEAKNTFEGSDLGEGAIFRWSGNAQVGEGSMTILESKANELIRIRLDFLKPFKDTATAEFTFKEDAGKTKLTWAMYGHRNFIGKAICMFMDMDKIQGEYFEQGLESLKEWLKKFIAVSYQTKGEALEKQGEAK